MQYNMQIRPNSPSIGLYTSTSQARQPPQICCIPGFPVILRLSPCHAIRCPGYHVSLLTGISTSAILRPEAMPSNETSLPTRAEFLKLARTHTLVPLYRTLTADLETPVTAFLRLAADEPECFLLESVEQGEKIGRYTFIGIRPFRKMTSHGRTIEITENGKLRRVEGNFFALGKKFLSSHKPARIPGLPPFTAGAVGFFAYDVVRQIERLPSLAKDELGVPDACLMFFDQVLAFDHVKKEIRLIVTVDLIRESLDGAYDRAVRRLNRLERRLASALPPSALKPRKRGPEGKLKL